jgi:hypothetical protein
LPKSALPTKAKEALIVGSTFPLFRCRTAPRRRPGQYQPIKTLYRRRRYDPPVLEAAPCRRRRTKTLDQSLHLPTCPARQRRPQSVWGKPEQAVVPCRTLRTTPELNIVTTPKLLPPPARKGPGSCSKVRTSLFSVAAPCTMVPLAMTRLRACCPRPSRIGQRGIQSLHRGRA